MREIDAGNHIQTGSGPIYRLRGQERGLRNFMRVLRHLTAAALAWAGERLIAAAEFIRPLRKLLSDNIARIEPYDRNKHGDVE